MKRMVLILTIMALILAFSNVSVAEITEKGVKVGLNLANIGGSDAKDNFMGESPSNKMGFAAGAYILYPMNESITMRVEALYSQKGAKAEGTEDFSYYGYSGSIDYKIEATITYIEIPILFQYDIQSSGNMKPCVFAGPYLAMKMGAKLKVTVEDDTETDDIEDVKGMDYGIIVGVGAKLTEKISVDARYSMGLTSIDDSDEDFDLKNKVIAITAGYALN